MQTALLQLAEDFLSSIVFLVIYLAAGNLTLAVGAAVAIGVGQFVFARWRDRPLQIMQALSLVLVIAFGAAALITSDSRFMMAKPSVIHFAIGAVMLRPGWLTRYLPPIVKDYVPERVLVTSGYGWAFLMFALGSLNLYVAANFSVIAWGWFISVGAIGAKVAAFAIQYVVFRHFVRRGFAERSGISPQA